MQTNYTAHHVPKMSRFCFIAKNPAAKNSHLHDLCRIGTKHSIHGRLTNNMHRVNVSMIPNGVLPYGVQAAYARFRVAPARTIEVRHKAGRRPRIDGEHLKLCSLTFVLFYYSIAIENYGDPSPLLLSSWRPFRIRYLTDISCPRRAKISPKAIQLGEQACRCHFHKTKKPKTPCTQSGSF